MNMWRDESLSQQNASGIRTYVKRRPKLRSSLVKVRAVWRRLLYLYLLLGRKPERKIAEDEMPILRSFNRGYCSIVEEMGDVFTEYTDTVSYEGMPISFESACMLWSLCEATSPKRILDMGSGFSSFVFRRYRSTAQRKPEVWSVDEDREWLEKTRAFLMSHDLPDDNLFYWGDFQQLEPGSFDLISLDLGNISHRPDILEGLLPLLSSDGLVLLDDIQNPEYRTEMMRRLHSNDSVAGYSVRWLTLDKFLRYCLLVRRR